jgi:hypothetical protein
MSDPLAYAGPGEGEDGKRVDVPFGRYEVLDHEPADRSVGIFQGCITLAVDGAAVTVFDREYEDFAADFYGHPDL